MRILIPVDGSKAALAPVAYLAGLAGIAALLLSAE